MRGEGGSFFLRMGSNITKKYAKLVFAIQRRSDELVGRTRELARIQFQLLDAASRPTLQPGGEPLQQPAQPALQPVRQPWKQPSR